MKIKMPQLSEGMVRAKLLRWNVAVHDYVTFETILAEVEADKANMEIEAPKAGRVVALHGVPGEEIAVGVVLIELDEDAVAPNGEVSVAKVDVVEGPAHESALARRRAEQAAARSTD